MTYDDVAVLTRTRAFGRELQVVTDEYGIPVAYEGGEAGEETAYADGKAVGLVDATVDERPVEPSAETSYRFGGIRSMAAATPGLNHHERVGERKWPPPTAKAST